MGKAIGQILKNAYLDSLARDILQVGRLLKFHAVRKFCHVDRQLIANYIQQNEVRKLHIGCGGNILSGWLNSDYYPKSAKILHLDTTHPFPINNNEFDYIFNEHMIEHISYPQGLQMLIECFRILRVGGTIRISTPDLAFLIDLYRNDKSSLQKEYIKWATDRFIRDIPYYDETFVINNFVRNWGHLFIYDEKILRSSLEKAGFNNITRCDLNQSAEDALRNIENKKRMPEQFLKLETITLEGKKLVNES